MYRCELFEGGVTDVTGTGLNTKTLPNKEKQAFIRINIIHLLAV